MTELNDIGQLLQKVTAELKDYIVQQDLDNPAMVGIHTGGAWLAQHLHQNLDFQEPLGTLDISFYRDDFSSKGLHPQVKPSSLSFSPENRHIILVDDVLMTGRTIRAALNEIFDYGRPQTVTLVALIDIKSRELPIQADIIGQSITLPKSERIKLRGPDPLNVEIHRITTPND
ncbi:MAG: bifunctional pyr operon transcriptional regulator/uracil phosphoribosyltransferase [Gammaproteobacteria bacterium]|nr:MAG: bifunctional pyr operon transcriptional regulator/uracil phosphoribosyltransferase [Gammaproteobacteria bacterium]